MADKGWRKRFEDPIPLPVTGRLLFTLEDAAAYIMKLRKPERDLPDWQTAGEMLIGAAEGREFLMHAHIAMMRALNRDRPAPVPVPRRKAVKAYRIVR